MRALAQGMNATSIGALVSKVSEKKLLLILESLTKLSATPKDDQLRDIANLGLRTAIKEIAPNSTLGTSATIKLTPSLLEQLNDKAVSQETMLNTAELLLEIFSRFETSCGARSSMPDCQLTSRNSIRQNPELQQSALKGLVPLLTTGKPAVKKRAVEALGTI